MYRSKKNQLIQLNIKNILKAFINSENTDTMGYIFKKIMAAHLKIK